MQETFLFFMILFAGFCLGNMFSMHIHHPHKLGNVISDLRKEISESKFNEIWDKHKKTKT